LCESATIGTVLLLGVVATSLVIVRRRLSYECGTPCTCSLVPYHTAATYWRGLDVATIAILVAFRLLAPLFFTLRHENSRPAGTSKLTPFSASTSRLPPRPRSFVPNL